MKEQTKNNALKQYMSKLMLQHRDSPKVCISPDNARIPLSLALFQDDCGSASSHNSIHSCLSPISSAVSPRINRTKQSRWSNSSPAAMIQAAVVLSQEGLESRSNAPDVAIAYSRNNGPLLSCVDGVSRSRTCPKDMLKSSMGQSPLTSPKGDRSVPPPPSASPSADRWTGKGPRRACSSPPSPPCRKQGSVGDKVDTGPNGNDRRLLLVRSNSRRSLSSRNLVKSKESTRESSRLLLKRSQSLSSIHSKSQSHTASTKSLDYSMEDEITNTTIHTPTKLQYRERESLSCKTSPLFSRRLPESLREPPY